MQQRRLCIGQRCCGRYGFAHRKHEHAAQPMPVHRGQVAPCDGIGAVGQRRQSHGHKRGVIGVNAAVPGVHPRARSVQNLYFAEARFQRFAEPYGDALGGCVQDRVGGGLRAHQIGVRRRSALKRRRKRNQRRDQRRRKCHQSCFAQAVAQFHSERSLSAIRGGNGIARQT